MTEASAIRVVLFESQRLVREAFQSLLEESGTVAVVGEAGTLQELLDTIDAQHPDVALISVDVSDEQDLALVRKLPEVAERVRPLIVMSAAADAALHARAIQLGAVGIVPKHSSREMLVKAVEKVRAGELWLDRARAADVVGRLTNIGSEDDPDSARIARLTPREREIVTLVAEGLKNRAIAERLFISEATARNHLTSILDKLDLSNRFQLAVFAFRKGLISWPPIAQAADTSEWPEPAAQMTGAGRDSRD